MTCPRCAGRCARDAYGEPSCITCGWTDYGTTGAENLRAEIAFYGTRLRRRDAVMPRVKS